MQSETAFVGARGVDSFPYSLGGTCAQARALKASGVDFFVGYLGRMNPERLGFILDAGLAFMPVTVANTYDGVRSALQAKALGLPAGCTVWLDLEGKTAYETPPSQLIAKINTWADAIKAAKYEPGLYVGSPQPLTGEELWKLNVVRYWKAPSRVFDRFGRPWDGPEKCGFCMWQMWPQHTWKDTGVFVDVNMIGQDHLGRLPTWVRK